MKRLLAVAALFATPFINPVLGGTAFAADYTAEFDAKHKTCLEQIGVDADIAYEDAMIWRSEGGGRRARHCEAMALFAVGQKEEAAHRLDKLATAPDGGSDEMRMGYYAEAANFWLLSEMPDRAYASATAGLKLDETFVDLRIARARSYALLGRYADAETDLSNALVFERQHPDALRYRADARRKQGKFEEARADIEQALIADPTSVETALVRGEIIEAIRLKAIE